MVKINKKKMSWENIYSIFNFSNVIVLKGNYRTFSGSAATLYYHTKKHLSCFNHNNRTRSCKIHMEKLPVSSGIANMNLKLSTNVTKPGYATDMEIGKMTETFFY